MQESRNSEKKQPVVPAKKTQPIKIKEFEWYEVETKVREIMGQLMQPFNKKQTQQTVKINELKRNITTIFKRHEEYDFLLEQGDRQKPKYLQLQDEKIDRLQQRIAGHELNIESRVSKMENTLQVYQEKIVQLNSIDSKLDGEIKERIRDFDDYKDNLNEKFDIMIKRIEAQNDEVSTIRGGTRSALNKLEVKLVAAENKIRQNEDQHKRKTSEMKKLFENVMNNNQKMTRLELRLIELDERLQVREKDAKMSEKFFAVVEDVRNDLGFIKGYLQRYLPLYTQMQISDTLNSFLKGRNKRLLCVYEEQAFARIHNDILNTNDSGLQSKMADYGNRIRHIINRNKKYIINYKVDRTIRFGQNLYEIRLVDQTGQDQEENKKPVNVIVPQADIRKVVESKWSQLLPLLKNQMFQELKPTKLWIQEIQEQAILRAVKTDQLIQRLRKEVQTSGTQFELFKSHIEAVTKDNSKRIDSYSRMHSSLIESVKDVINFGSVINHIVIQDEIDRQGLALYALKAGSQQPQIDKINPTIQLDPKCLACSSSGGMVNQAFKMACLAYNPSEIKIDQQTFSREEILEVSTNILEKMKTKIDNMNRQNFQNSAIIEKPKVRNMGSRRSQSQFSKDSKISTINISKTIDNRSRQMQTLLPVLANTKKSQRGSSFTERQPHSVLY